MNYPTPANPLVLNFTGHIPAMKNQKVPGKRKDGSPVLLNNATVTTFMSRVGSTCLHQVERQGFDLVPRGTPIAVYVDLWFYVANETNIANSDDDNAYTTLQEMLMPRSKKHPYFLGVIEDDSQVISHRVDSWAVKEELREGARLFVFTLDNFYTRRTQWRIFEEYYDNYMPPKAEQLILDVDEVLTILT